MQWLNNSKHYGVLTVCLHWLLAVGIIFLFFWGLWMAELDYGDAWEKRAPYIHKGVGVLVVSLMMLRFALRAARPLPDSLASHKAWEKKLAHITHLTFYVLVVLMFITGYIMTTGRGRGIDVFGMFTVPALFKFSKEVRDFAEETHEVLAWSIISLVVLHVGGALKHTFFDKDGTLKRMLGK